LRFATRISATIFGFVLIASLSLSWTSLPFGPVGFVFGLLKIRPWCRGGRLGQSRLWN